MVENWGVEGLRLGETVRIDLAIKLHSNNCYSVTEEIWARLGAITYNQLYREIRRHIQEETWSIT